MIFFFQICLDINDTDEFGYVDSDVFDLPEQNLIREDALRLVRKYRSRKENSSFNSSPLP